MRINILFLKIYLLVGLWGIFALYQLVRLVWDEKHALVSATVMAVLPGSVFVDRSFLPDPAMVSLITTCLWMLVAYHFAGDGFWIWDGWREWWEQKFFLPQILRYLRGWLWSTPGLALVFLGLFCLPPRVQENKEARARLNVFYGQKSSKYMYEPPDWYVDQLLNKPGMESSL